MTKKWPQQDPNHRHPLQIEIERLRAALRSSICPAGNQTVEDCIRDGCGCENGLILGSVIQQSDTGDTDGKD